jgi:hypothetical protein
VRFIVDIYRYMLLGLSGVTIISTMVVIFMVLDPSINNNWATIGSTLLICLVVLLLLVIGLSGIAILISMHDRHAELVDEAADIALSLRRLTERGDGSHITKRRSNHTAAGFLFIGFCSVIAFAIYLGCKDVASHMEGATSQHDALAPPPQQEQPSDQARE